MKTLIRQIALFSLLALSVSACNLPTAPPPTVTPTLTVTSLPPSVTVTVAALPTATATETPLPPRFFTEEFDAEPQNWSITFAHGDPAKLQAQVKDGSWDFDLNEKYMYVYLLYTPQVYDNVRLDVKVDNRGENKNFTSLVCRYSADEGWYEVDFGNDGRYYIMYGKWNEAGAKASFGTIADGGSTFIRTGRAVNEFGVECKDNTITVFINGNQVRSISENRFGLRKGQAGFGVSSFNILPISVHFDWFKVSGP